MLSVSAIAPAQVSLDGGGQGLVVQVVPTPAKVKEHPALVLSVHEEVAVLQQDPEIAAQVLGVQTLLLLAKLPAGQDAALRYVQAELEALQQAMVAAGQALPLQEVPVPWKSKGELQLVEAVTEQVPSPEQHAPVDGATQVKCRESPFVMIAWLHEYCVSGPVPVD
jgi:hypothetical protein